MRENTATFFLSEMNIRQMQKRNWHTSP
jgi:hypothetical protein